jgi:hypothetical protein
MSGFKQSFATKIRFSTATVITIMDVLGDGCLSFAHRTMLMEAAEVEEILREPQEEQEREEVVPPEVPANGD